MEEKVLKVSWHAMEAEEVLKRLESPGEGLSDAQARQRQRSP